MLVGVFWGVLSVSTPVREGRQVWAEEGVECSYKALGDTPKGVLERGWPSTLFHVDVRDAGFCIPTSSNR